MSLINLVNHPSIYFQEVQVGSLLPMSRDMALDNMPPEATHILFIDSDMKSISPEMVTDMLDADKDIIAPIMVQRKPPFFPAFGYFDDPDHINSHEELAQKVIGINKEFNDPKVIVPKNRMLAEVRWCGLACTLVKKRVFDRIARPRFEIRSYPDMALIKERRNALLEEAETAGWTREELADKLIDIGIECNANNVIGEDILFCAKAAKYGFKTWVHLGYFIEHVGETGYHIGDFIEIMNNPTLKNRMETLTYVWRSEQRTQETTP